MLQSPPLRQAAKRSLPMLTAARTFTYHQPVTTTAVDILILQLNRVLLLEAKIWVFLVFKNFRIVTEIFYPLIK